MAISSNENTAIGGFLNGEYIPLNELSLFSQKMVNGFDGLVLIREKLLSSRTKGTLWYKGKKLIFTVEDLVTRKKIYGGSAVPDNVKDPSKTDTFPPNPYYLTLDTTGKDSLTKNYVKFPNDKRSRFRSPGVFSRVGTEITGVNLEFDGFSFAGIRIHAGSSENSSEGCIIVSRTRNANSTVTLDVEGSKALTKWIYNNLGFASGKNYAKIMIINNFDLPPPPPTVNSSITVINSETNQPIEGVQVNIITGSQEPPRPETPASVPVTIEFN